MAEVVSEQNSGVTLAGVGLLAHQNCDASTIGIDCNEIHAMI